MISKPLLQAIKYPILVIGYLKRNIRVLNRQNFVLSNKIAHSLPKYYDENHALV